MEKTNINETIDTTSQLAGLVERLEKGITGINTATQSDDAVRGWVESFNGIGGVASSFNDIKGVFESIGSLLGKGSWAGWLSIATTGITALIELIKASDRSRNALKGMGETAKEWQNTVTETFYSKQGLSFFGMGQWDFARDEQTMFQWMDGVLAAWEDGSEKTDAVVYKWGERFRQLTNSTRTELQTLSGVATDAGHFGFADQIENDIAKLDQLDEKVAQLLEDRKGGELLQDDKNQLLEWSEERDKIEIKYHLSPADSSGFDSIIAQVRAEEARAKALGKEGADVSIYENAVKASAQGMAAANSLIDAQYDKEYKLIQLMTEGAEKEAALTELNATYLQNRQQATEEYKQTLEQLIQPVWQKESIQQVGEDMDSLFNKLTEYKGIAGQNNGKDRTDTLVALNQLTKGMDKNALIEYYGLLTQIQSLQDSGFDKTEVSGPWAEIDVDAKLKDLETIRDIIYTNQDELADLQDMFGTILPNELIKIAADLDMTKAQEIWEEFAQNPKKIIVEPQGPVNGPPPDLFIETETTVVKTNQVVPTPAPTATPEATPTPAPTATPEATPTAPPTATPEATPTPAPTSAPTPAPGPAPAATPTGDISGTIGKRLNNSLINTDISEGVILLGKKTEEAFESELSSEKFAFVGNNIIEGIVTGINESKPNLIKAIETTSSETVTATKKEYIIASPSRLFRDEIGRMLIRGQAEGMLLEAKAQEKAIINASRFIFNAASGSGTDLIGRPANAHTYNSTSNANVTIESFYAKDETDVQALASQINGMNKRAMAGYGVRR